MSAHHAEIRRLAELRRLSRVKSIATPAGQEFGVAMVEFFKQSVARRQTRLAKISEAWGTLVPAHLCDHTALQGLTRGTLTVIVDSSAHLYELKQLLLAGLQDQLLFACKSAGLRKIVLKPGRWYIGDAHGDRKIKFN